ncbi:MAG: hypothetical protein HC880_05195 [Bacteroidia bacterium]|nr:hypothetical protein [Bacteroidia bacterium]
MRVVANIPHREFGITIFAWNHKYLIKFEKENLEQTYKISEFDILSEEDIQSVLENETFMNKVAERFEDMRNDLLEVLQNDY